MNERIKELMKKSMVKSPDMSKPGRKELNPEKFAELIVQECARIAEESDTSWSGAGPEAASQIKKHFGVE
jgi:hypothetical protein